MYPEPWNEDADATPVREETYQPVNLMAERSVLGACMIDPDATYRLINFLRPEDFFGHQNRWIAEAIWSLSEKREPIDFVSLVDVLEKNTDCKGAANRLVAIGGPAYLTDLFSSTPTALNADHYGKIVWRCSYMRRHIMIAGKISEMAYDPNMTPEEITDKSEALIFAAAERRFSESGLIHVGNDVPDVLAGIEQRRKNPGMMGVPLGFEMLDRMLNGLQRGDLAILAARPGMGKSGFMLTVARNVARLGGRIVIFSLEMSREQLILRLISMITGIDGFRLRAGNISDDEWIVVMEAANVLNQSQIYIDDTPAMSATDIRIKARRLHMEHSVDLIIIDYLQLMTGQTSHRNENRQQEISYISRSLAALARELNVPVLALSQLSRAVEQRADKRPMLSDLRESGSIEQDAAVVMFIYREDYYIEDTDRQNIADLITAKHRHGASGTVSLFYRKELTEFRDLEIQRSDLDY